MKSIAGLIVCLAFTAGASAQQKSPTVGGSLNAEEPSQVKDARRAILKDTLARQYSAEEIDAYRRLIDAYEKNQAGVYSESAKVIRRRVEIGLKSDDPVQELRLNAENVGTMVLTDSLGAPWQVEEVIAPGYLTATKYKNMIVFRPKGGDANGQAPVRFARGSVTVLLAGLNSSITLSLSYGLSREVDGQMEAQVQARNPNAIVNAVQGGSIESDEVFGLFLDGEPPRDALKLRTSVKGVDAWAYSGRLYVRTTLALHSPAFRMYGGSASGTSVYRFDQPPTVINAIDDGVIIAVSIGE